MREGAVSQYQGEDVGGAALEESLQAAAIVGGALCGREGGVGQEQGGQRAVGQAGLGQQARVGVRVRRRHRPLVHQEHRQPRPVHVLPPRQGSVDVTRGRAAAQAQHAAAAR